jgi:hypothetical protein
MVCVHYISFSLPGEDPRRSWTVTSAVTISWASPTPSPVDPARFVPEGHPTVFDITKRKIHNVLQAVAPPGVEISDVDKKWFELWIQQNCEYAVNAVPIWPESRP